MSTIEANALFSIASLVGRECGAENVAFMKCKQGDANPAACLDKGGAVCACVLGVMKTCQKKAGAERAAHTRPRDTATHRCANLARKTATSSLLLPAFRFRLSISAFDSGYWKLVIGFTFIAGSPSRSAFCPLTGSYEL